jgi:hypothetical protein
MTEPAPPDWLVQHVKYGVAFLAAAGLPGSPSADDLPLRCAAYAKAVYLGAPALTAEDGFRLRKTFSRLVTHCLQFPPPAEFLRVLGRIERDGSPRKQLRPPEDPETTARALALIAKNTGFVVERDEAGRIAVRDTGRAHD